MNFGVKNTGSQQRVDQKSLQKTGKKPAPLASTSTQKSSEALDPKAKQAALLTKTTTQQMQARHASVTDKDSKLEQIDTSFEMTPSDQRDRNISQMELVQGDTVETISESKDRDFIKHLTLDVSKVEKTKHDSENVPPLTTPPVNLEESESSKTLGSALHKVSKSARGTKKAILRPTFAKLHHRGGHKRMEKASENTRFLEPINNNASQIISILDLEVETLDTKSQSSSQQKGVGDQLVEGGDFVRHLISNTQVKTALSIASAQLTADLDKLEAMSIVDLDKLDTLSSVTDASNALNSITGPLSLISDAKDIVDLNNMRKEINTEKKTLKALESQLAAQPESEAIIQPKIDAQKQKIESQEAALTLKFISTLASTSSDINGTLKTISTLIGETGMTSVMAEIAGPLGIVGGLIEVGESSHNLHKGVKRKDRARQFQKVLDDPSRLLTEKSHKAYMAPLEQRVNHLNEGIENQKLTILDTENQIKAKREEIFRSSPTLDWSDQSDTRLAEIKEQATQGGTEKTLAKFAELEELKVQLSLDKASLEPLKEEFKTARAHQSNLMELVKDFDSMSKDDKTEMFNTLNIIARNVKRHQGTKTNGMKVLQGATTTAGGVLATVAIATAASGLGPPGWALAGTVALTALAMEVNHESEQLSRSDLVKENHSRLDEAKQNLSNLKALPKTQHEALERADALSEPRTQELTKNTDAIQKKRTAIQKMTNQVSQLEAGTGQHTQGLNLIEELSIEVNTLVERNEILTSDLKHIKSSFDELSLMIESGSLGTAIKLQEEVVSKLDDALMSKSMEDAMGRLVEIHGESENGRPTTQATLAYLMLSSTMHQDTQNIDQDTLVKKGKNA